MKYSKPHKAYRADVKLKEGHVFKFFVDGAYKVSREYETTFVLITKIQ